jgi:hypothetical protein
MLQDYPKLEREVISRPLKSPIWRTTVVPPKSIKITRRCDVHAVGFGLYPLVVGLNDGQRLQSAL